MIYNFENISTQKDANGNDVLIHIELIARQDDLDASELDGFQLEPKVYTEDEIRNICFQKATERDWFNILKKRIETQKGQPIQGTSFVI